MDKFSFTSSIKSTWVCGEVTYPFTHKVTPLKNSQQRFKTPQGHLHTYVSACVTWKNPHIHPHGCVEGCVILWKIHFTQAEIHTPLCMVCGRVCDFLKLFLHKIEIQTPLCRVCGRVCGFLNTFPAQNNNPHTLMQGVWEGVTLP